MEEYGIGDIPTAATQKAADFSPFGTAVTKDDVAECLSQNLYAQLSERSDKFVLDAVSRAETYIGAVLSYLHVKFDLDDKLVRQIVLMQSIYELHMALGHEEAGREYRIQAKNTIIAAYGSFPDTDNADTPPHDPAASVVRPNRNPRMPQLWKARGLSL